LIPLSLTGSDGRHVNSNRKAGRRVRIVMPDIGSDLNDELMAAAR